MRRKTILFINDISPVAAMAELAGAAAYARRLGNWRYHSQPSTSALYAPTDTTVDGILGHLDTTLASEIVRQLRVPAVSIVTPSPLRSVPLVSHDHLAIGQMAAGHLAGLGFRHFAYIGADNSASDERLEGFSRALAKRGFTCIAPPTEWSQATRVSSIKRILARLPLPCALFTFNDQAGITAMDAARELGIAVPEQLAIMGVDNNVVRCEFTSVTLSSIDVDLYSVGYRGAELLDSLMSGRRPPHKPILIPPRELVRRRSTDIHVFDDREFAQALQLLRDSALSGRSIKQLMREIPMARVRLERQCRRYLGHSPAREIRGRRIEEARRLLADTQLKAQEIARRCGFVYLSHFSRLFSKEVGMSPKAYRDRNLRLHTT